MSDPLDFDFGLGFVSMPERMKDERADRIAKGKRSLPFYHAFLDDYLHGIMPNDLILLGAESGAGKTELARWIAASNAARKHRVFYFALEAEAREIERRTKFQVICDLLFKHQIRIDGLSYLRWYRGEIEAQLSDINAEAEEIVAERYSTLFTYYRGSKFDHDTVRRLILAHQDSADLFVLDHLHYVDVDDENENRGFKHLVKIIRDVSIAIDRPVVLVAHLRKQTDQRRPRLVPTMHDFHGSSDILKIATDAILLAPAWSVPSSRTGYVNTFFSIPKAREAGATNLIACCPFDTRRRIYDDRYTIGRESKGDFEPLGTTEAPRWARRHEGLSTPMGAA
jgi:replicative DNA helicase